MSDPLLLRTAKAMYRADLAPKQTDWSHLTRTEQQRYEVLAAAALAVALSEPAYPDLKIADLAASEPAEAR